MTKELIDYAGFDAMEKISKSDMQMCRKLYYGGFYVDPEVVYEIMNRL